MCFIHLFLRLKDKFLPFKMGLGCIVIYQEFRILKKSIANPCPNMERGMMIIGDIDTEKFSSR